MKSTFLLFCLVLALPIAGCAPGKSPEKKKAADHQPTEKDMENVRVFFLQEWNKKFSLCNDWYYTRSDAPLRMYLSMKTNPSLFNYEWQPLGEADRVRDIRMRCMVFVPTDLSMVHANENWSRPFKKASGYLVATDLYHGYPGPETRENRNSFLESECLRFKECIGFTILVYADGRMDIVDDGKYWHELTKPENCGEIPE